MNLTQLQAAIQAKGYTTDTAAQQVLFLNEVYREICGMDRWPFLEKQDATIVTVAGTEAYVLPMSDWRSLDAVRIEAAQFQQYVNLNYQQPQDFRDLVHVDRDLATPTVWTWMQGALHFYPIPDGAYTVRVDYITEPPDLATGADIPVLPVPYHDILVWGAIESSAYRARDWLGRQFAQEKKEQMLKRMTEEYLVRQRQSGSHVKKSRRHSNRFPFPLQSGS